MHSRIFSRPGWLTCKTCHTFLFRFVVGEHLARNFSRLFSAAVWILCPFRRPQFNLPSVFLAPQLDPFVRRTNNDTVHRLLRAGIPARLILMRPTPITQTFLTDRLGFSDTAGVTFMSNLILNGAVNDEGELKMDVLGYEDGDGEAEPLWATAAKATPALVGERLDSLSDITDQLHAAAAFHATTADSAEEVYEALECAACLQSGRAPAACGAVCDAWDLEVVDMEWCPVPPCKST
eukprot:Polyplicarium_translucidae@DN1612_c0_g1_i1.p2